ncbi:hypothetical protein BST11_18685 [Mycobacterium alsense]|uniref:Uncharacterized protein n=1 Tax=Mycobacterium alsense TaxID=324058 RepID=A0AA42BY24_9MYCO|nr:hypothetical protein [Mycobacterium alsense]MCV7378264.1 hypothetical protein [Mycobacterium alsense]OQZ89269.1 hypothetical protein BST11_18685 [Mycobacterium alsense]
MGDRTVAAGDCRRARIFVDELARFAADRADPRLAAVAERAAMPLRVAVCGRRGVGRRTVARALGRAPAISVTGRPEADVADVADVADLADVAVYVTTEVVKPEDTEAIAAAAATGCPVLVALNKSDLAMLHRADPRARCADFAARVGAPVEPMSGLLAVAALDGLDAAAWAALRAVAAAPGGATCLDGSADGFLAARLPVPADTRRRLLDGLGVFGTALSVAALQRGGTPARVCALLRRCSGVDAVLKGIAVAGAGARYRRVLRAVAELEALAVRDGTVGDFLARDDTVVARMAAAVELAEAAGLGPLDGGDPGAHLPRALRWQRYGRGGALGALHRACAADITRGSLRLWSRAHAPGGCE